jgi:V8-like Glu-specific endopeptidase
MRLALLPVLVLLLFPAAAQAKPETRSPAEIAAYWTKERMQKAIPREAVRAGDPRPTAGKPTKPGTAWTRLAVPMPYAGPDLNNGKVFMTMDGVNYVCSGTSVAASSGVNLVWTAGHCVNEGPGDNATSFMFAPGYVDGTTPHGKWVSTGTLDSPTRWEQNGDYDYDVGAARVVGTEGAPPTLSAVATPRAMAFGYPVAVGSTRFQAYGYPAAGKFNGQRMYVCDSTVSRRDGAGAGDPMGIGCDMTGGSSGGGWIDTAGAVGSVNSYGYTGIRNTMFGPYQGSVAQSLYESMR